MSVRAFISSLVLVILITASSAVDMESDESPRTRMVSDSLREVEGSFVQILGQSRQVMSFARFTHEYGKKYQNEEEIKHRFSVFKKNLDYIRSHNKKGLSYKLGVTQFADLTKQEFQMSNSSSAQDSFATLEGSHNLIVTAGRFPRIFDWRTQGAVSRVKNQGLLCTGGSWAFSATGAIESAYHRNFKVMRELSEQQLIDCSYKPNGTRGCVGGFPSQAFDYINSNGLTSEQEYPYIGVRGLCRRHTPQALVRRFVRLRMLYENHLEGVIVANGPVSISFAVKEDMLLYSGGIYDNPSWRNGYLIQHALAVGYGTEGGKDFWVIKNSWGESWGENGYLKLRRGANMCGIVSGEIAYPILA